MLSTMEQFLASAKSSYDDWITICNALSLSTLNGMSELIELNAKVARASLAEYAHLHKHSAENDAEADNRGNVPQHYDSIK